MYKEYDVLGAGEEDLPAVDELGGETEPTMVLEQLCDEFERQDLSDEVILFGLDAVIMVYFGELMVCNCVSLVFHDPY